MYITRQLKPLFNERLVIKKKIRGKLPVTFKPGGRVDKSHAHIWMTGTLDHEAMCIKCMDESWSHKELWITSIYIIGEVCDNDIN